MMIGVVGEVWVARGEYKLGRVGVVVISIAVCGW